MFNPQTFINQTIKGQYTPSELIRSSSCVSTYKAVDQHAHAKVIFKRFDHLDHPQIKSFIKQMIQAQAQLTRELIVPALDFDQLKDGRNWVVLERQRGKELNTLFQDTSKLKFSHVLEVISSIIQTVSKLHQLGFIHGNLKPSNIFLVQGEGLGKVRLSDIGHKELYQVHKFGSDQLCFGDPSYFSFEQATSREIDQSTDICGIGATIHYLLTGKAPFKGSSLDKSLTAVFINSGKIKIDIANVITRFTLSEYERSTVEKLSNLVERSLHKNKEQRPSLQEIQTLLQVSATPTPNVVKEKKSHKPLTMTFHTIDLEQGRSHVLPQVEINTKDFDRLTSQSKESLKHPVNQPPSLEENEQAVDAVTSTPTDNVSPVLPEELPFDQDIVQSMEQLILDEFPEVTQDSSESQIDDSLVDQETELISNEQLSVEPHSDTLHLDLDPSLMEELKALSKSLEIDTAPEESNVQNLNPYDSPTLSDVSDEEVESPETLLNISIDSLQNVDSTIQFDHLLQEALTDAILELNPDELNPEEHLTELSSVKAGESPLLTMPPPLDIPPPLDMDHSSDTDNSSENQPLILNGATSPIALSQSVEKSDLPRESSLSNPSNQSLDLFDQPDLLIHGYNPQPTMLQVKVPESLRNLPIIDEQEDPNGSLNPLFPDHPIWAKVRDSQANPVALLDALKQIKLPLTGHLMPISAQLTMGELDGARQVFFNRETPPSNAGLSALSLIEDSGVFAHDHDKERTPLPFITTKKAQQSQLSYVTTPTEIIAHVSKPRKLPIALIVLSLSIFALFIAFMITGLSLKDLQTEFITLTTTTNDNTSDLNAQLPQPISSRNEPQPNKIITKKSKTISTHQGSEDPQLNDEKSTQMLGALTQDSLTQGSRAQDSLTQGSRAQASPSEPQILPHPSQRSTSTTSSQVQGANTQSKASITKSPDQNSTVHSTSPSPKVKTDQLLVTLISDPPGATFFVGKKALGQSPLRDYPLDKKTKITARKLGYRDLIKSLAPKAYKDHPFVVFSLKSKQSSKRKGVKKNSVKRKSLPKLKDPFAR